MDTYKKKYEEALERAKKYHEGHTLDVNPQSAMEYVFPELEESKDEKIRKSLIILLKHFCKGYRVPCLDFPVSYKDMLAWLEKQGEQANPYSGISFEYNGHTWGMCARDNGVDILLDKQLFKHLENQSTKDHTAVDSISAMEEPCVPLATIIREHPLPESKEESEDEKIRNLLIMAMKHLSDKNLFFADISKDKVVSWLEKQGTKDRYTFNSIPRLLEMIKPTDKAKVYCQKLIDSLRQEGYATDAKIVGDCLKQMNNEKVASDCLMM